MRPRVFRRLQWQLTASYMKVTFVTTVATLGLLLLLVGFFTGLSPRLPRELAKNLLRSSPRLRLPLAAKPTDRAALKEWLQDNNDSLKETEGVHLNFGAHDPRATTVIYDAQGTLQAQLPVDQHIRLSPREQSLLQRALRGEENPSRLAHREPGVVIVAAAPIEDSQGRVLGALLYRTPPLFSPGDAVVAFLLGILPSALLVALSSGLVAGISGYLSARRLTRRFDAITRAADLWARGDFNAVAPESDDEMGLLAGRLNRMAAELRDLMALRQDIATLEERNRLARDLHDTVKQNLFATAMQLGAARALLPQQPDAALDRLHAANDLAQQAQRDLTAVLQELRPVSAESAPLTILLKGHVTDWSRRTSILATFETDTFPNLPPEATNALLRIAQEALANAAKHSRASRVEVSLRQDEQGGVRLLIRDNGCGFDSRQRRSLVTADGGMGLHTMRERVEALPGGRLQILSTPGGGTCVVARCDSNQKPPSLGDFVGMEDAIRIS